jgi:pilus assembly protein CpaE
MPVVVDTDREIVNALTELLPSGVHAVENTDRLKAWLSHRQDEYAVFLGPNVPMDDAAALCEALRVTAPTTSVILVRDAVDTSVLSRAMQAGARDVVLTSDETAIKASVERAHALYIALRGPGGAAHTGRVITVFAPKGGVGKTTTAVNLSLAISDRGARKVCLVDLDLAFGDVAITMQLFPSHTIEEAIGGEEHIDENLVQSLLTRHEDSLMVLAAPSLPDARDRVTSRLVSRMLRTLKQQFDYVVIDTAPNFDEQTLQALDETDDCVIITTLDVPTLKNVKVALETLDLLSIAIGHRHLVLNRADDEVGIGPDKVEQILGMKVTAPIPSSLEVAAATNLGKPIVIANPDHPASIQFRALAKLLTAAGDADLDAADTTDTKEADGDRRGNRRLTLRR